MKEATKAFLSKVPDDIADSILIEQAMTAMSEKLEKSRKAGAHGWHTPDVTTDALMSRLLAAVESGDMVDTMNYAAMIHVRNELYGEE